MARIPFGAPTRAKTYLHMILPQTQVIFAMIAAAITADLTTKDDITREARP